MTLRGRWLGTPRKEYLAIVLPPVFGGTVLGVAVVGALGEGGAAIAVVIAAAVVAVANVILWSIRLARKHRLFLRNRRGIERSSSRIARIGIPLGWLLGAGLLFLGGYPLLVAYAFAGGFLLAFWPFLVANFLRLRREEWLPDRRVSRAR